MLTKQEAKRIMKTKGEIRGDSFKTNYDYLLFKKGERGVKELEDKMAELGYPLRHKDIRRMEFYPLGLYIISWLAIKEIFKFSKEEFKEWGYSTVRFSIIIRILMKFFGSIDLVAKEVPKAWRRNQLAGNLEAYDYSAKKKYVILRLRDWKIDPTHCIALGAYFSKITELVVKAPVKYKETKCMFRGDPYHEYHLTW